MVTKEVADKYHLKKVSDLKKYKDELRLGMDTQWMNRQGDGYPAFQKTTASNLIVHDQCRLV